MNGCCDVRDTTYGDECNGIVVVCRGHHCELLDAVLWIPDSGRWWMKRCSLRVDTSVFGC